jgi:hypothetical protein
MSSQTLPVNPPEVAIPVSPTPAKRASHESKRPTIYKNGDLAFDDFNTMFCYIEKENVIVRLSDGETFTPDTFMRHQYVNWLFKDVDTKGNTKYTQAARKWFGNPRRNQKDRMDYVPGKGRWDIPNVYNRWTDWGSQPVRGDISLWNELLNFLFRGGPAERKYFEQWLAYPLQHPGAKLHVAAILRSLCQGVGKNTVAEVLMRIYGKENSRLIGNRELHGRFNSTWLKDRQFIVGDEAQGGSDKRSAIEQLKSYITNPTVETEQKYRDAVSTDNKANFLFLTNNTDPFYINDKDRRFWAWEIPTGMIRENEEERRKFYADFHKWSASAEGISALHYHLLHLDLTGFHPHAPAPMTSLKRDMIEFNRSDVDRWLQELPQDQPDRFAYTSNEVEILWGKHCAERGRNVTKADSTAIQLALKDLCKQADTGTESKQIKLSTKKIVRLWIVATPE